MRTVNYILPLLFLFFGCESLSQTKRLDESFIRSLKEKNFELLNEYIPTVEFYKSIPELAKRNDTEIKNFLKQSNDRLKESWQKIADRLIAIKTDLSKIELVESIIHDPFEKKSEMLGMIVVYKYDDKAWDDLSFIVSQWKGKTFLLEIPNPTRAFTFYDETLKASSDAKASLEMKKPEFKKSLEEQVKRILNEVKENNGDVFMEELVYRGEDESRKWKTALNGNQPEEKQEGLVFMKRVRRAMEGCDNYKTGELKSEKESEGTWIILQLICGKKTVSFAFLRIGTKVLLGDIDTETNE